MPVDPIVEALSRAENLPEGQGRVDCVSTHCSWVFLTDQHVYKVKRPKNYGFLDYSTLERREHYCREEVRLNRRTAPDVYLGVLPVREDERGISLARGGRVVDWAVHMRRLPEERSFLSLAGSGRLGAGELAELARCLASFYSRSTAAAARPSLLANVRENFDQVRPFVGRWISAEVYETALRRQREWLERHAGELIRRPVVDGHGDLRLEHVYLLTEGPTIIDCIEFTDRFRVGDPALDVAFLIMDLRRLGLEVLAEHLLGCFAYESDDYDLYPLADGYVSYRAFVRGKVACFVAGDPMSPPELVSRKAREATGLFDLACSALLPRSAPRLLVAVGGLVASGKTTVAQALARTRGLPHVSADATRKSLAGIAHEERADPTFYSAEFSARVQDEVLRRAERVLESGRSVIVDTTFRSRALRQRARQLAHRQGAGFRFVECVVPEAVARARLRARQAGVSDAREEQWAEMARAWEPVVELPPSEHHVCDTTRPLVEVLRGLVV